MVAADGPLAEAVRAELERLHAPEPDVFGTGRVARRLRVHGLLLAVDAAIDDDNFPEARRLLALAQLEVAE